MEPVPGRRRYYHLADPFPRWTTDYLRRLLIERHHIRASIENPGGSLILTGTAASTEQANTFSSDVGNTFHLDLIEVERLMSKLPKSTQQALLSWADGLTSDQAAVYFGIRPGALRKRRERGTRQLAERLKHDERGEPGQDSREDAGRLGPAAGKDPA